MTIAIIILSIALVAAVAAALTYRAKLHSKTIDCRRAERDLNESKAYVEKLQNDVRGWSNAFAARRADGRLQCLFYDDRKNHMVDSANGACIEVTGYSIRYVEEPKVVVDTTPPSNVVVLAAA
jgi:hypothetical protein